MSNTSIQLKKSGVTGNVPVSADLHYGEVALNYADGKLYYKNALDDVSFITNQDSFATVNVGGSFLLATSPTDILTLSSGNNIVLVGNTTNKSVYINLSNTISVSEIVSNTTSRIYTHANLAFNAANSAGSYANSAFQKSNAAYILAQGAFNKANTGGGSSVDDYARVTANAAFIQANAAFEQANTGSGSVSNFLVYHFPIGDYGSVSDPFPEYSALDDIVSFNYDMKTMPTETNGLIQLDAGYV
jgi:hypothetical protein